MDPITNLLQSFVDKGQAVGASALIVADGKELYRGAAGYADKENGIAMTPDKVCRIFSMTKIVTSVAAMKLYERGLFKLSDPVSEFLPAYKDVKVIKMDDRGVPFVATPQKTLTMRNLLTMTAGFPYGGSIGNVLNRISGKAAYDIGVQMRQAEDTDQPWTTRKFVDECAKIPMAFEPGEAWVYGLSCDILGGVVEAISGKTLGDFMKEEIFEPLGMKHTGFKVPAGMENEVAVLYDYSTPNVKPYEDGPGTEIARAMKMTDNKLMEAGGAGLYSTLDDYSAFARMLAHGGTLNGVRVLGRKTVEKMATNHLNPQQLASARKQYFVDQDYGYGMLVQVMMDTTNSRFPDCLGSFGWGGAAGTCVRIDPKEKLTVVFFIQRLPSSAEVYMPQLMQAAYGLL